MVWYSWVTNDFSGFCESSRSIAMGLRRFSGLPVISEGFCTILGKTARVSGGFSEEFQDGFKQFYLEGYSRFQRQSQGGFLKSFKAFQDVSKFFVRFHGASVKSEGS